METITFKNKEYEILERLGEHTFKVGLKGKVFVLKTFHPDTLEFPNFIRHAKRLKISGVKIPKLVKIDKKEEKVLLEYIDGVNVFDVLAKEDLTEPYFKKIFEINWYANAEKITLDFHPDNYIMTKKNELYYVKFDYTDGVKEEDSFKTTYIKLWFFTKEFFNYAKSKGIEVDPKRLKDEYNMNKEIVLTVVKYYI